VGDEIGIESSGENVMKYAILVIALVVTAFLIIDFNNRSAQLNYLTMERETVEAQLAARQVTKAALQTQIAYATSEAAVLEYGYNNHLIRPGDIAVVPVQPTAVTPTPVPETQPEVVQMSYFQRWLLLIFGPSEEKKP
jgi:hypothetical protein